MWNWDERLWIETEIENWCIERRRWKIGKNKVEIEKTIRVLQIATLTKIGLWIKESGWKSKGNITIWSSRDRSNWKTEKYSIKIIRCL
jgi:hypothetical protein